MHWGQGLDSHCTSAVDGWPSPLALEPVSVARPTSRLWVRFW